MVVFLFAAFLGLFNPLKIVSPKLTTDTMLFILTTCLAFCLFAIFRKRKPIILSTQELAQIISLPTAITKLPVALGKIPLARMQLGCEQTHKHNNKNHSTNKLAKSDNYGSVPI
jgi:hypothetical protein